MAKKIDFSLIPDELEKNDDRYSFALPAKMKLALAKLPKSRNRKIRDFIRTLISENAG